jgi:hypothetical protein
MECEIWYLTLRKKFRLRALKQDPEANGEDSTMRNFIVCIVHLI